MASHPRTILVTGATGKQGAALIQSLVDKTQNLSSPAMRIFAVTRNPNSSSAQRLATNPNITLITGDLSDPAALFSAAGGVPIWGVYSVQVNSDAETAQGKGLVDAAVAAGARHFVYSSGDRGGPEKSAHDATKVKNFAAKFAVEKYLEAKCAGTGGDGGRAAGEMTFTVLRPVTFFENQTDDRHGSGFARMWEQLGRKGDGKLQMVATRDIGWFGAEAFLHPEHVGYRNAAVTIAGDELSAKEAARIFEDAFGKEMPMAPCPVGSMVKFFLKDTVGDMFKWFETDGYGADVQACRKRNPEMLDYRTWLTQHSSFAKA